MGGFMGNLGVFFLVFLNELKVFTINNLKLGVRR